MIKIQSFLANPILSPTTNKWEKMAVFNGSILSENSKYYMVYRAVSEKINIENNQINLSTIGIGESSDKYNFFRRKQLIVPENDWEKYGCEDPRITKIEGKYYIFYTALGGFPPNVNTIKVAVAVSNNLEKITEKHLITPFNAKAMALFPQKINGKLAAVLTVNTDRPPAKIALAFFDKPEEMWSADYWRDWYGHLNDFELPINRMTTDQIEVGAAPVETEEGWLLIYAHIQNYYTNNQRIFGIEAVLLDKNNPQKIIGRTREPIMVPQESYEMEGMVPNVIFPSGAIIENGMLYIYYGAADNFCALATCKVDELLEELKKNPNQVPKLKRYDGNPIISLIEKTSWETKATFNPAAILLENKVHIIYRAMSKDNTSVFGYAVSNDGFKINRRDKKPIYQPTQSFESKLKEGVFSGCEDPRITQIGGVLYMCYTAFDGQNMPRIALTSITLRDFLSQRWKWKTPIIISKKEEDNKDGALLPEKVNDEYIFFHRSGGRGIAIDYVSNLEFDNNQYLDSHVFIPTRPNSWDSKKIGIAMPPIKTEQGWLLLYHGVSKFDNYYRVGAMLLDLNDVSKIISRSLYPLLEPEMPYEKNGEVNNVVFPCGAVEKDGELFVYYGAADKVIGVATCKTEEIINDLLINKFIYNQL